MSAARTAGPLEQKPSAYRAIRDGSVRTYLDLITVARSSSYTGTCCACYNWGREVWKLSTRASICENCARRKANQVLGSIRRAERRAMVCIKKHPYVSDKFVRDLTGVSQDFIDRTRAALAKAGVL